MSDESVGKADEGGKDDEVGDEQSRPALRIVRGEPDAEEIAALTALLTARSGDDAGRTVALRGAWGDPARTFTRMPIPGPNAWRSSGW